MIKIQKYNEVEAAFFKGRDFDDSNEVVTSVLEEVQKRGDAALRLYGQKFDVAVPAQFEVPQEELRLLQRSLELKSAIFTTQLYIHMTWPCVSQSFRKRPLRILKKNLSPASLQARRQFL
jgi:histidinol dehydrogenase